METLDIALWMFVVLFFVGMTAGFVDSIAGGGGLIALPALLAIGLPPTVALGTNKLQGTFGTFSATVNFISKKQVTLRETAFGILFTFIGATTGTLTIQHMDASFLQKIIPYLLFAVVLYTLLMGKKTAEERPAVLGKKTFFVLFGLLIGFYDGFFGPGTGSFWTAACMMLLGTTMTKATGITKVMNFTSNISALIFFFAYGNVVIPLGITMGAGQLIGARIGSGLAIKKGAPFIRPVFLVIVTITIIRLVATA